MELQQARRLLGLADDATREDIESRFRLLAASTHPDKGGTDVEMAKLLEARDALLRGLEKSSMLVPVDILQGELQRVSAGIDKRREIDAKTEAFHSNLKKASTNKLRMYRNISIILGALAAAALFLGKEVPQELLPIKSERQIDAASPDEDKEILRHINEEIRATNEQLKRIWLIATFGVAIYAGAAAWLFVYRIERVEENLRELEDELSIKTKLYAILSESLGQSCMTDGLWSKWKTLFALLQVRESINGVE
jgi:hypothetical protein